MSTQFMAEVVLYESDQIPPEQITHPPCVGEALFAGLRCPNCGYWVTLGVDPSAGNQAYIEDCPTCCRPIEVRLQARDLNLDSIEALRVH